MRSPELADGEPIPASMYAPDWGGESRSPALEWSGFPPETKSFAVTCFDPDAPTGAGFWHWAVYNIPASVTSLPAGAGAPRRASCCPRARSPCRTSTARRRSRAPGRRRAPASTGTCFVVHAVDVPALELPERCTPTVLAFNLNYHSLARARVTPVGSYEHDDPRRRPGRRRHAIELALGSA